MSSIDYWFPFQLFKWERDAIEHELSLAQEALYLRLCLYYMKTKIRLPASDAARASVARIPLEEFMPIWGVIHRFFHRDDDGRWSHPKCDAVIKEELARSQKHKKRAKKAANARWKQEKEKKGQLAFEHADSNAPSNATRNATGQDRTGQDNTGEEESQSLQPVFEVKSQSPLPPAKTGATGPGNGVKTSGKGNGGGGEKPFQLRAWLDANPDAEMRILRDLLTAAPGYDRYALIREYDATSHRREGIPSAPEAAFMGWARKLYGKKG